MTTYKLFANVNPLEPNCLLCVMSSHSLCMGNKEARAYLIARGQDLKSKGYKVELQLVMVHNVKI